MINFWHPPAIAIWLESAKMVPYHHPICLTSLGVRPIPKVSITVVATAKRVTKKAKKWWKIAILWLFLSHSGDLWRRNYSHINIYWHPWFGAIFSTFGYLEVLFADNSFIVLRMSWKEPAPLAKKKKQLWLYFWWGRLVWWFWWEASLVMQQINLGMWSAVLHRLEHQQIIMPQKCIFFYRK